MRRLQPSDRAQDCFLPVPPAGGKGSRMRNRIRSHRLHRLSVGGLALALALSLSGCDNLLEVELPGATTAEALDDPGFATLLTTSVQGEFECAYSSFIWGTSHLGGEIIGGFVEAGGAEWLQRNVTPASSDYVGSGCGGTGVYAPMATARALADDVIGRLEAWSDQEVPGRSGLLAQANLYAGYNYVIFGDAMCSAAFDNGPEVQPPAMFELARDRFTEVISLADDAEIRNAAYVGLARANLSLGDNQGALSAAEQVSPGFSYDVSRSSANNSRRNIIYLNNNQNRRISIDPHYWDVTWMGAADPRVDVTNTGGKTTDGVTDLWLQTKYGSDSAPYRLASHVEAQLIIAEVVGGQRAVDIINELHTAAGIPPFEGGSEAEIRAQVIEERRREFFLEGKRFGDLRRYGGFDEWTKGTHPFTPITYGGNECMPLPNVERFNNPSLSG